MGCADRELWESVRQGWGISGRKVTAKDTQVPSTSACGHRDGAGKLRLEWKEEGAWVATGPTLLLLSTSGPSLAWAQSQGDG